MDGYEVTVVNWTEHTTKKIQFESLKNLLDTAIQAGFCSQKDMSKIFSDVKENQDPDFNRMITYQYHNIYDTYYGSGWTRIVRMRDSKSWPSFDNSYDADHEKADLPIES
ncbi:MAG: hypothetical protein WD512_02855, partial [Candidatus Paceibacterota bacterium]